MSSFGVRMSAISYTVAKQNISVVASVTAMIIQVGTDIEETHALYNIVEIHELVILIATLALATHVELKNQHRLEN